MSYNVYMSQIEQQQSEVLTVRIPGELKSRLEKLSRSTARTKSWLAIDAIRTYLEEEEWQVQEIQKGLEEVERNEVATPEEVEAVFSRWR